MKIDLAKFDGTEALDPLSDEDFEALAKFRFALRRFLEFSEGAANSAAVTTQQYQAMLAIRANPDREMSIKVLADEMMLRPNGAVQMVDRLEALGMVARNSSPDDRRSVLVTLTRLGNKVIKVLAAEHVSELIRQRPLLVESLRRLKAIAE